MNFYMALHLHRSWQAVVCDNETTATSLMQCASDDLVGEYSQAGRVDQPVWGQPGIVFVRVFELDGEWVRIDNAKALAEDDRLCRLRKESIAFKTVYETMETMWKEQRKRG